MKQLKNLAKIVGHFIFTKSPFESLTQHRNLVKTLNPFKAAGYITNRTFVIYLFSYVAKFLNTKSKLALLDTNYSFLMKNLSDARLQQFFGEGIMCFEEINEGDHYKVLLKSSHIYEFEGSNCLVFTLNDTVLFTMSFSIAPGKIFGVGSETIIYVSGLKGTKNEFEKFSRATKYFKENIPSVILLKVLEAVATNLGIKVVCGIAASEQLSFIPGINDQNFYSNYDEFWTNLGAPYVNGSYQMELPMQYKDILLIKQKYRNRTVKKRKVLDDIFASSYSLFGGRAANPDDAVIKPIYPVAPNPVFTSMHEPLSLTAMSVTKDYTTQEHVWQ